MRNYFEFQNSAKINCGEDAARTLGYELNCYGAKRPFVICSIEVVRSGITDRALSSLDGGKKGSAVCFDGVPKKTDVEIIREMKSKFEKEGCDAIVAIGDAVVLESAKILRTVISQKCDELVTLSGIYKSLDARIPMVFIPTELTRGVSLNGMIADGEAFVSSPDMIPNVLIIDREISEKKPLRLLAEGAVYALGNALEAYIGAEEDDLSEIYAEKAIKLLFKHVVKATERAGDKDAAVGIALASALAGVAYGNVPFGKAHALSEALRDVAGISEEEAMTLSIVATLKTEDKLVKERVDKLIGDFEIVKGEQPQETAESEAENAETATVEKKSKIEEWVDCLCESAGIINKISETTIQRELFGEIAEAAQNKRAAVTSRGAVTKEEFLAILNAAY